ncbi:MAG: HD domain-containing protein [Geobacter sp.]|nr:HD domain-containing protein [Geobacter sp.]
MTGLQLESISEWFDRFVASFTGNEPEQQRNYDLKTNHTRLVQANIERLAEHLHLAAADRALASAIAICHDVGRFPQFRDYGTFNDATSTNHASLAITTLKNEGILDSIASERSSILLQAVALHNVFILPDNLDPVVARFTRLIRDADKLDIWRVLLDYCTAEPEERASAVMWGLPDTGRCSENALQEVAAGRMLQSKLLATADDFKLLQLSWVFDLNFDESFRIVAERGYIEALIGLLPAHQDCREAIEVVTNRVKTMAGRI